MQRKPRQDPVSCQLCRSKKLKCNREHPCSNCIARGVTCHPANGSSVLHKPSASNHPADYPDVVQRLRRLENAVFGTTDTTTNVTESQKSLPTPSSAQGQPDEELRVRDEDTRELENAGTRDSTLLLNLSDHLAFQVCNDLSEVQLIASSIGSSILVALPDHTKALELLEHYSLNVDHTVRVLHKPTIYKMMDKVYSSLSSNQPVPSGQAALLLAVFTMSVYFSLPAIDTLHETEDQEHLLLAKVWGKGALDALDHSRRTTSGSLEDVQASILMSFVLFHFDGLSARGRMLVTDAIAIGRDLRLHLIDEWDLPDSDFSLEQRLDREIKRRVWWHIASTDWIVSSFSGPQEGFYFVHPHQMHVRLPNECTDDDLTAGRTTTSEPAPEQQYFLQRIKFAQLCREVMDVLPIASRVAAADYDSIQRIDRKLLAFLTELPPVLRINEAGYSKEQDQGIPTSIIGLRYYINTSLHGRRCKLHQPFLIRQSIDPRYAYSRQACLESARTVFRLQEGLDGPFPNPTQPQRVGTKSHFLQLATVVLVMDICFNESDSGRSQLELEVRNALEAFKKATITLRTPLPVLRSLITMLHKHNIKLPDMDPLEELLQDPRPPRPSQDATTSDQSTGNTVAISYACPLASSVPFQTKSVSDDPSYLSGQHDATFDPFWQFATHNTDNEAFEWDQLFSGLDTRMI